MNIVLSQTITYNQLQFIKKLTGVIRKLFPLTFKVGITPKGRNNTFKRVCPSELNDLLVVAKVPSEWPRRTRRIEQRSVSDLKASGNNI